MAPPFLKVPREIRDMIYMHAITFPLEQRSKFEYSYCSGGYDGENFQRPQAGEPTDPGRVCYLQPAYPQEPGRFHKINVSGAALLLVNKQINSEAADILYGHTRFAYSNAESNRNASDSRYITPTEFLTAIGPANAARLRHLVLDDSILGHSHQYLFSKRDARAKRRAARLARGEIARLCSGLRSVEVSCGCLRTYRLRREEGDMDVALLAPALRQVQDELVAALPSVQRTVLVVVGTEEEMATEQSRRVVRHVREELGWEICRLDDVARRTGRRACFRSESAEQRWRYTLGEERDIALRQAQASRVVVDVQL